MEVVGRKKYCCKYPRCNNWYYSKTPEGFVNKHYFKFPQDPHYHHLWRTICGIDDSKDSTHYRVCEDHFADRDFVNVEKRDLNPGVVPVAPNEPSEIEDVSLMEDLPFPDETNRVNRQLFTSEEENAPCSSHMSMCSSQEPDSSPQPQNSEVASNLDYVQDHDYCSAGHNEAPTNLSKFSFLEGNKGISRNEKQFRMAIKVK